MDTDLCASCYNDWKLSDGKMSFCRGHTFLELPRACWYEFEEGVVMEDGSTLPQVVDMLEQKFSMLLERAGEEVSSDAR